MVKVTAGTSWAPGRRGREAAEAFGLGGLRNATLDQLTQSSSSLQEGAEVTWTWVTFFSPFDFLPLPFTALPTFKHLHQAVVNSPSLPRPFLLFCSQAAN